MPLYEISILHQPGRPRLRYLDGEPLILVFSFWLNTASAMTAQAVADFVTETLVSDLDILEEFRGDSELGEERFLAACTYRLMGFEGLGLGDVVHVRTPRKVSWLAFSDSGWDVVRRPVHVDGAPLTAAPVLQRVAAMAALGNGQ